MRIIHAGQVSRFLVGAFILLMVIGYAVPLAAQQSYEKADKERRDSEEIRLDRQLKQMGYDEFLQLREKGHGYSGLKVKKDIQKERRQVELAAAAESQLVGKANCWLGPTGYIELPSPDLAPKGQFITDFSFVRNSGTKTTWQYFSLNYGITEDAELTVAKYDMQVSYFGKTVTGWTTVIGAKYLLAPPRDNLKFSVGYYYGYLEKFLRGRDLGEFFGVTLGKKLRNTHIGSLNMELAVNPTLDVLFVYLYEGGGLGADSGLNLGFRVKPNTVTFKGLSFMFEFRQHRGRYDEMNFGIRKDMGENLTFHIFRIQTDRRAEDAPNFSPPASGTGAGLGLRF